MNKKAFISRVKKAVKYCQHQSLTSDCGKCPYRRESTSCVSKMLADVLYVIEFLEDDNTSLHSITGLMNKRKYYRKFVDTVFRKQPGKELSSPDFDYIYQLYFEQRDEIDHLNLDISRLYKEILRIASMTVDTDRKDREV